MAKVQVVQKPEKEIPVDVLAESIVSISEGVKKIRSGRLNDKALYLLIQHASEGKPPVSTIRAVIDGMASLEGTYLKRK